jgi:hypothetical protein
MVYPLSIEQSIEAMQHQGAQCQADKHGGEKVSDHGLSNRCNDGGFDLGQCVMRLPCVDVISEPIE